MAEGKPECRYRTTVCGAVAIAVVAPLLAHLDLQRLHRCLEPSRRSRARTRAGTLAVDPCLRVEAVGRLVDRVICSGRPLTRPGCLTRGITAYYVMRRAGLDVALCFGIGPVNRPEVVGHCWLVLDGEPVLEVVDPRLVFTELVRLSARGVTSASPAP